MTTIQEYIKTIPYEPTQNINLVFDFETTVPPKDLIYDNNLKLSNIETEVWAGCYTRLDTNDDCVHSKSIDEFMTQILSIKDNVNLYSFNGAKFDNYFILHWLMNNDFKYVSKVEFDQGLNSYWCGDATQFTIYNDGYFYNFIDSRRLLVGQSIGRLGKILSNKYQLDMSKGDTPLLENKPSDNDERWREWLDYIERDVLILKLTMEDEHMLIHRLVENNMSTQAGWAFNMLISGQNINTSERELRPLNTPKNVPLAKDEVVDRWITRYEDGVEVPHYITRKMTKEELTRKKEAEKVKRAKRKAEKSTGRTKFSFYNRKNDLNKRTGIKTKAKPKTNAIVVELKQRVDKETDEIKKSQLKLKLKQESYKLFMKIINDIAKTCYRGGLCMVGAKYMLGLITEGQVLDYTSHYPAVYGYERLPGQVIEIDSASNDLKDIDLSRLCIVTFKHIHAKCKENRLPIFKPKTSDTNEQNIYMSKEMIAKGMVLDKRNVYPREIDYVKFSLPHCEVEYLIENYNILDYKIDKIYYFEEDTELMNLCRLHVDKWAKIKAEARAEDNVMLEMLAKIMLNAPYGKFGNYDKQYPVYNYTTTSDGRLIETKVDEDKGGRDKAEVPVAAYITAYGRVKLANAVNKIGYERFIYCDTDSIHISGWEPVPDDVDTSGALGELKHESYFKDGYYIKPKTYGEYTKIKEDKYKSLLDTDAILKADEDGYYQWHTTCAGISVTIPPEQFNIGAKILDKRSYKTNGGISIIPTYINIKPIQYGQANLIQHEYGIKIPDMYVEDGAIYKDLIDDMRHECGYDLTYEEKLNILNSNRNRPNHIQKALELATNIKQLDYH